MFRQTDQNTNVVPQSNKWLLIILFVFATLIGFFITQLLLRKKQETFTPYSFDLINNPPKATEVRNQTKRQRKHTSNEERIHARSAEKRQMRSSDVDESVDVSVLMFKKTTKVTETTEIIHQRFKRLKEPKPQIKSESKPKPVITTISEYVPHAKPKPRPQPKPKPNPQAKPKPNPQAKPKPFFKPAPVITVPSFPVVVPPLPTAAPEANVAVPHTLIAASPIINLEAQQSQPIEGLLSNSLYTHEDSAFDTQAPLLNIEEVWANFLSRK